MATITRLSQQKRKNRVNVYLDGKFGFGVTLESALENHLKVGQELSQEKIEQLRGKDYLDINFSKLVNFASRRPRSEKEIKDWFRRKNIDLKAQNDLFNRLNKTGLVNDEEFAKWWVEQRIHFRLKPPKMLKLELRQKGIRQEVIEKVLSETESPSELELARKVILKKFKKIPIPKDPKDKKRVYDFLLRRGFSYNTIKEALAPNCEEEYN